MSERTFLHTLIRLKVFQSIFGLRQKIDFLARGNSRVFAKSDQILKSAFFTCFVLRHLACRKTPFGVIFKCK